MVLQKYKIRIKFDLVYFILWQSLKIVNIDILILLTKIVKTPQPIISYNPINNKDLVPLKHTFKKGGQVDVAPLYRRLQAGHCIVY